MGPQASKPDAPTLLTTLLLSGPFGLWEMGVDGQAPAG